MEKMIDHQYRENSERNIHSNYNQMRAYVECSLNQSKKNSTLSTFPSSNRRNFEDSGIMLAVSVSQFYKSIAAGSALTAQANKMVITTVCVQIDNCFYNT